MTALQQLVNVISDKSQQGRQSLQKPQTAFIKEDMQYWATYFFTEKLELPFQQILQSYQQIYGAQSLEDDTNFMRFHLCNCMLVLIEWWLIKAQNYINESSSISQYGKKPIQTSAFTEILELGDEVLEILNNLEVAFIKLTALTFYRTT